MKVVPLCALVTFLILALMAHAVLAEKALRLKVSPAVSFEPAKLAIQVRLHPDPDDRWITVGMDSGAYQRFSGFTIEGDRMFLHGGLARCPCGRL